MYIGLWQVLVAKYVLLCTFVLAGGHYLVLLVASRCALHQTRKCRCDAECIRSDGRTDGRTSSTFSDPEISIIHLYVMILTSVGSGNVTTYTQTHTYTHGHFNVAYSK